MSIVDTRSDDLNLLVRIGSLFVVILFVIVGSGCATVTTNGDEEAQSDPYEKINRVSYDFTDSLDRMIMKPVSGAYLEYVPTGGRRSIGNFYDNLAYPNTILNSFLQGKVRQGFEDTLRFAINTTIGLVGLFDVATHMGLEENNEDFGQTLAVWGVDSNEYWFIPVLGPSSQRDAANIPVSVVTNALFYAGYIAGAVVLAPIMILGAVDKRARMSESLSVRDEASLDPYLFVREAYMQQREYLVYDGEPPLDIYLDPMQEDVFHQEIFLRKE
jgi:phospholipid-binding lipoprotein MlaA